MTVFTDVTAPVIKYLQLAFIPIYTLPATGANYLFIHTAAYSGSKLHIYTLLPMGAKTFSFSSLPAPLIVE